MTCRSYGSRLAEHHLHHAHRVDLGYVSALDDQSHARKHRGTYRKTRKNTEPIFLRARVQAPSDAIMNTSRGDIKVFAIYQILLGWKTCKYYYETHELLNPRPTQPKKK